MGRGDGAKISQSVVTPRTRLSAANRSPGIPAPPAPRHRPSAFAVTDGEGRVKFNGCLLKIDDTFYLDSRSCSLLNVEMPSIEIKGETVYPIPVPPEMANIVGPVWAALGASSAAPVSSTAQLSELLHRFGLHRKSLGGKDDKPLDDPTTRFWFGEVRRTTRLPLTSLAGEDGVRGMGCARDGDQLEADISERLGRVTTARRAGEGAARLLKRYDETGDWSSWRSLDGNHWSTADKAVAAAVIGALDNGRLTADDLITTARDADPRQRSWSTPGVRELVNRMRAAGVPVNATTAKPAGYWIEEDPSAYRKWLAAFKDRNAKIYAGAQDLRAARVLWFPRSAEERDARAKIAAQAPAPSKEALKRINRVSETEARKRRQRAERKQTKMEGAKYERARLQETVEFQAAFDLIETRGQRGTVEQRELVEKWKSLGEKAKGKSSGAAKKRRPTAVGAGRPDSRPKGKGPSPSKEPVGSIPIPF